MSQVVKLRSLHRMYRNVSIIPAAIEMEEKKKEMEPLP